jgi:hypothetical protein
MDNDVIISKIALFTVDQVDLGLSGFEQVDLRILRRW